MRKIVHPDFPDYLVCEDGSVERRIDSRKYHKAGDVLRGRILVSGYRQFKLFDRNGKRRLVRANRLVCEAFHGLAPTIVHHAAHEDGQRLNNNEDNLYWATPKQNKMDSMRHGTHVVGSRTGTAKLTEESVAEARRSFDGQRGSLTAFAQKYGVTRGSMKRALDGETWAHVSEKCAQPKTVWLLLTEKQKLLAVAAHVGSGLSAKESAHKLQTTRDVVSKFAARNRIQFLPRWEQHRRKLAA